MARRLALRMTRDRLMVALLVGAFFEILWTIYLGWRLPRHYVAENWDLAWVGLDVAEVALLFACAWAAWRQRAILIVFSISSATLFLLDAWFDITTANHGDVFQSVVVALVVEVPSAAVLLWVSRRAVHRFFATHNSGSELPSLPIRKVSLRKGDAIERTRRVVAEREDD